MTKNFIDNIIKNVHYNILNPDSININIKNPNPGDIYYIKKNGKYEGCYVYIISKDETHYGYSDSSYDYKIIDPKGKLNKSETHSSIKFKYHTKIKFRKTKLRKIKSLDEKAKVLLLI